MSIQSGKMTFYYMARENLCFLTLVEDSYPKRLAFLYLEEVADALLQELIREFGNEVGVDFNGIRVSCVLTIPPVAHQSRSSGPAL